MGTTSSAPASPPATVVLPTGLTVFTQHLPRRTVCLMVVVAVGSRHEHAGFHGLAHVLEHMVFVGTRDFPESRTLSVTLDRLGAKFNAYTSLDHTCYHILLPAQHLEVGLHLLAQMVLHPLLRDDKFQKEKEVVKQEILKDQDNPHVAVQVQGYQSVFRGHPTLTHAIAGTIDDIDGHTVETMRGFWREHYRLPHMALLVTGQVEPARTLDLAATYFAPAQPHQTVPRRIRVPRFRPPPPHSTRALAQVHAHKEELDQCHACLLFPLPFGFLRRHKYALHLLSLALGGYMSSRLWTLVREQHGWAYTVYAEVDIMQETSVLMVYMGLDPRYARQALRTTLRELQRVARHGLTAEELEEARGHALGSAIMTDESPQGMASFASEQLLYAHLDDDVRSTNSSSPPALLSLDEEMALLQSVTLEEVNALAAATLRCRAATLATVSNSVKSHLKKASPGTKHGREP